MKRFYIYLLAIILPASFLLFSWPSGSPGGRTGSPGDEGATCHGCHSSFDVIGQAGWISSDIPAEGYTPGETYTITATGMHEGVVNFGFELTAEDNIGTKRGTLSVTDTDRTKFTNADKAITHTAGGITPTDNMNSWSMEWTAPAGSFGTIGFYAAFNAGNGTGGNQGDQIYTSTLFVDEMTTGIGDDLLANQVKIYPNPATNFLNIDLPNGSEVRVVDMLGHQLVNAVQTNKSERLDISGFDNGIYFVQVLHNGHAATMKFLKN